VADCIATRLAIQYSETAIDGPLFVGRRTRYADTQLANAWLEAIRISREPLRGDTLRLGCLVWFMRKTR